MALQHLRSSTADKRPTPAAMSDGQLALNTNLVSPGLFFKDSNGDSVKIGPVHVGTTAPNVTPGAGGQAGNSKGEQWLDTSSSRYVFKIWDGTAWRSEDGEFVNSSGDTMTGALVMDNQQQVQFRETTANGTNSIALQAPAAVASDRTLTLPDVTGTIVSTGDTGSVTSTMILDGTIVNADINASAEIAVSKLEDGAARQLLQTDAAGTGVEWASNIDIPGTLDVTGATVFDSTVVVNTTGALTLPDGTTAQRPASPATGDIRFNTTFVQFEGYDGAAWGTIGGGGPLAGFRNAIINGNFDIWQRGTSFTGSAYGADRWFNSRLGTTQIVTRQAFTLGQTDVPGEPTYYWRTVVSSVTGIANSSSLQQRIEDVRTFAGQQVTLSFWAKVDASKSIAVELIQDFGTGGSPSTSVVAIGTTKVSIGTSWQKVTVTATLPSISSKELGSNGDHHLRLNIWFDAGSVFNARTDNLGHQSGTFDIAQVQLEPGPVATPFERRPIGMELALCQRYHFRIGGNYMGGLGTKYAPAATANMFNGSVTFPSSMRASPNLTWNSPSFVNATAGDHSIDQNGATLRANSSAAGSYRMYGGTLIFDAEI